MSFIKNYIFYIKHINKCAYVQVLSCDNPYLYSDIYVRLLFLVPFMYFVAYSFRSQKLTLKADNLYGVSICISISALLICYSISKNVFDYLYHEVNRYDIYWKLYMLFKTASSIATFDYYYKCFRIFSLIRVPLSKLFVYLYLIMKYVFLLFIPVIIFPKSNKLFQIIFDKYLMDNEFYEFYCESFCLYSCFYYLLIPYVYDIFPEYVKKYLKIMIFITCLGKCANMIGYALLGMELLHLIVNNILIIEIISLLPMFLETFPLLIIISMLNDRSASDEPKDFSSSKSLDIPLMT